MNESIFYIIFGVVGVISLIYKNPQKDFLLFVAVSTFLVFLSMALIYHVEWAIILWRVSSLSLLLFYFLRFIKKQKRILIDYLKWIGVILLIAYPIYSYFFELYTIIWPIIDTLTVPILAAIYLYDRFILKPEKMKKKFVIILSIQTILILLMLIFAFVQKLEADQQRNLAEQERIRVDKLQHELFKLKEEKPK